VKEFEMQEIFVGLTLGNDPHTVGIHKAGKIARSAGIGYQIIPPATSDDVKLRILKEQDPQFIGLSYRLSPEIALVELRKFLTKLDNVGLIGRGERRIGFAGLPPTLKAVQTSGLQDRYGLVLIGSKTSYRDNILSVLDFLDIKSYERRTEILDALLQEAEPEKIPELDQIANRVIDTYSIFAESPLLKPSPQAIKSLPRRIEEAKTPLIRTHFGIPSESIQPTVEGIEKIALNGAVDEISLGSSDLSQRYFGHPLAFQNRKNDGGVPYKTKEDLQQLYLATRRGNFPSIKPYAHVVNLKEFIDDCLEIGMLSGAHQAVPLFWFCELDGRGPLSVRDAIQEHSEAVAYLALKDIPVEMNDPNQWSSRYVHDTLFVVDYALIAAVMFTAGVKDMILQCQFNKPAETGDYADLGKMSAARDIVERIRPQRHPARVYLETRSGIEHFSADLETARFQLARTTLLQMILSPSMIHLVSYCEANHAATAEDVIESSMLVRRAVLLFKQNEPDLKKYLDHPIVVGRKENLLGEAQYVLTRIAALSSGGTDLCTTLSNPDVLFSALQNRIMTAPGITHPDYMNPGMLTKPNKYGFMDCYEQWDDVTPIREEKRLSDTLD
jgi:hypothetical protein